MHWGLILLYSDRINDLSVPKWRSVLCCKIGIKIGANKISVIAHTQSDLCFILSLVHVSVPNPGLGLPLVLPTLVFASLVQEGLLVS